METEIILTENEIIQRTDIIFNIQELLDKKNQYEQELEALQQKYNILEQSYDTYQDYLKEIIAKELDVIMLHMVTIDDNIISITNLLNGISN
jgi:uncharacterized protein involved in exopolysaccharide biosynthesis